MKSQYRFLKRNPAIHWMIAVSFVMVTMAGMAYLLADAILFTAKMIIHWLK